MPKQKTNSGAKKRFKVTGTGRLMRKHAMKSHNLEKKSAKRKRELRTGSARRQRRRPRGAKAARAPAGTKGLGGTRYATRQAICPRPQEAAERSRARPRGTGVRSTSRTARRRSRSSSPTSTPTGTGAIASESSVGSGSSGSTPLRGNRVSPTTSSSPAAGRPRSSSTARCWPILPSRPGGVREDRRARQGGARRSGLRRFASRSRDHLCEQPSAEARSQAAEPPRRERLGLLVCEGEDLVEAALDAGLEPVEALVDAERPALIDRLPTAEPSSRSCSPPSRSSAHPPRVLAVFRRADLPHSSAAESPRSGLRSGGSQTRGTSARSSARRMRLAPPSSVSRPAAPTRGPEGSSGFDGRHLPRPSRLLRGGPTPRIALVPAAATPLAELELGERRTFVLGTERRGLPDAVVAPARAARRFLRRRAPSPSMSRSPGRSRSTSGDGECGPTAGRLAHRRASIPGRAASFSSSAPQALSSSPSPVAEVAGRRLRSDRPARFRRSRGRRMG